jgi:Cof subfamily protein (haloacid dehalogenase superfamily)
MEWGAMIKLVAFDVDGTLRERDYMPESTKRAVVELRERGVTLTLCTGRSEYEMASLREELGIEWAVTCNGCHIGRNGKTVAGTKFPKETVEHWLELAEKRGHALLLYGAELMLSNRPDDPRFLRAREEIGFLEPVKLNPGEEVPDVYQCIMFIDEEDEPAYLGENRETYYLHRWRPWAIDVNPGGMHKAAGLKRLLELLGVKPEEAAAFGDGFNDLEMLEYVGVGIAMGNAPDRVKAQARHVTAHMHEGGIAHGVREFILAGR